MSTETIDHDWIEKHVAYLNEFGPVKCSIDPQDPRYLIIEPPMAVDVLVAPKKAISYR